MSRRRDLGSMFDEDGPGESPAPSEAAKRLAAVDEQLINDEARQMLDERSRAAREVATRAAEVASQKGKEFGKAALGALGRMKVERQRRAKEKAAAGKERQEAYDQTLALPMSASFQFADSNEEQHEVLLEGLAPEEVRAVLGDPVVREAPAPQAYDGMVQLSSEQSSIVDELVADLPVFPVGRGAIGRTTAPEVIPKAKRSYKRVSVIVGGVLVLAAFGGAAYWWSTRPAPAPVIAPKSEAAPAVKPAAPEVAPAVVPMEPAPASFVGPVAAPAPIEQPEAHVPAIEAAPEPVAAPVLTPAPVVSAPAPRPASIKPRPKKVEVAPATQAPKPEEQQIEQIRDFGKQLERLGGG